MRILIIIALLLPQLIFAQSSGQYMQGNNLYMIKGNGDTILINAGSTTLPSATLTSVTDIANYNNATTTTLFIKDSIRGGTFFLYIGSDAADNGMIFTDANNNKWKRQTTGDYITPTWYGAHQTSTASVNSEAVTAASNYIFSHWGKYTTLYIPGGTGNYNMATTMFYTRPLAIRGDGYFDEPTTRLVFPYNTSGIVFHEYNYDYQCEIKDISLQNSYSVAAIDSSKPMIKSRAKIYIDNVHIPFASGIGILLEACAGGDSTSNPIFGNVDFSKVTNNKINFALIGLRLTGCDANYVKVYDNDFMQCKRWGVDDNGFLGNVFFSNSFAANSNASIAGTATTVIYGGLYYSATAAHDDGSGIGKRPDQHISYWRLTTGQAATVWDTTKHYWSGGSRTSRHPSGTSQWYNNYEEGDQASPVQNSRSTSLFGVRGAGGVNGGTSIFTDQGTLILAGKTDIIGGNFGIGVSDVASIIYPLQVESTVNGTIGKFKTTATAGILSVEAAGGSSSYLWSQGGMGYIGTNGLQLQMSAGAFKDYNGNGVVDLGSAANQWKDVYAKRFFRDGVELTGAGGGITQQTLNDTAAAIRAAIPIVTGTNTGDNATNTQYSGLAASKQDILVSATNIKTINGTSVLGSGNIVVGGSSPTRVYLPNNVVNSEAVANTLTDVVGLTFPVVAGSRYAFKVVIVYSSAATTTGSRWVINGPAATDMSYTSQYPTTATAITNNTSLAGYNLPSASNASSLSTNNRCIIQGELLPSANGSVQVRFASEITASAITAIASGRSYLEYQIIN